MYTLIVLYVVVNAACAVAGRRVNARQRGGDHLHDGPSRAAAGQCGGPPRRRRRHDAERRHRATVKPPDARRQHIRLYVTASPRPEGRRRALATLQPYARGAAGGHPRRADARGAGEM